MGIVAAKLMIDAEDASVEAAPSASVPHGFEIPDGFVPATKAQVAYWRQLCGAITHAGTQAWAMPSGRLNWHPPASRCAPWKSDVSSCGAHGRGTCAAAGIRRSRCCESLPCPRHRLTVAERPAPNLPTFAELETWEKVCRWLDQQPTAAHATADPGRAWVAWHRAMSRRRRCVGCATIAWCGMAMTAPGGSLPTWKQRLLALWQGVTKAEGERQPRVQMLLRPIRWRRASTRGT